jgi:hypothetical protein
MPNDSHTPVTFSRSEMSAIREMLESADKPALCPRCTEKLQFDEPITGGPLDGCCYVRCDGCRRTAFITKNPPDRSIDLHG